MSSKEVSYKYTVLELRRKHFQRNRLHEDEKVEVLNGTIKLQEFMVFMTY